jgi:hypothetical protein
VSLAEDILARARAEGVTLYLKAEGKLGYQTHGRPLSPDLKALILEHRDAVLAALVPSGSRQPRGRPAARPGSMGSLAESALRRPARPVPEGRGRHQGGRSAKRLLERLAANRVSAVLDEHGALSLIDRSGRRRDLTRLANMGKTFETLVVALEIDPSIVPRSTRGLSRASATIGCP